MKLKAMKTRIIRTSFWDDDIIQEMSPFAQLLYIFLITCPEINMCGIFRLSQRKILSMINISEEQFLQASAELENLGKVCFYQNWVFVYNARRINGYEKSQKCHSTIEREISDIPTEIRQFFDEWDSTIHSTMDSTHKYKIQNIKNKNKGNRGVGEEGEETKSHKQAVSDPEPGSESHKQMSARLRATTNDKEPKRAKSHGLRQPAKTNPYPTLESIDEAAMERVCVRYNVPMAFVRSKLDDLQNYCERSGKSYKNYLAALRNFVKNDALGLQQEASRGSKLTLINPYD